MSRLQRITSSTQLPATAGKARRGWLAGLGLGLIAVLVGYFIVARHGPSGATVVHPVTLAATAPSNPIPAARTRQAVATTAAKGAPPNDLAVLRTASRDEILSYAHDLLANGGPLENVIALLEFLVNDRPELAVDLAREIGRSDGERQVLLYATLSAWADHDGAAALHWAFRNSDAYAIPGNASLLYIVLEQIATDDPASAVAATAAALRTDEAGGSGKSDQDVARFTLEALIKHGNLDLTRDAIEHWARGPETARLNPTDFQIVAMSLAATSYSNAGAWLESLPSSSARNDAYRSFATAWLRENASDAMDWAQGLNPADGGDDVRVATFAHWLKSDRSAATQWLRAHNSPDPTRLVALLNASDQ